jgi:hypothetical protein
MSWGEDGRDTLREDHVNKETEHPTEVEPVGEPYPDTAGEEDHEDVDRFRGNDADAPEDTGRPADETPEDSQ